MTQLQEAVAQVFAPQGGLALAEPAFTPRPGQTRMALAVAGAIEEGQVLVVEAGTGVGKTYAYLVPALLSGQRVLVSTATKALQDQLFARDLPRLVHGLGFHFRAHLLDVALDLVQQVVDARLGQCLAVDHRAVLCVGGQRHQQRD